MLLSLDGPNVSQSLYFQSSKWLEYKCVWTFSVVQSWCFLLLCAWKVLYTLDWKVQSLKGHFMVSLLCMCVFICAKYCVSLEVSEKLHTPQFFLEVTRFERAWLWSLVKCFFFRDDSVLKENTRSAHLPDDSASVCNGQLVCTGWMRSNYNTCRTTSLRGNCPAPHSLHWSDPVKKKEKLNG